MDVYSEKYSQLMKKDKNSRHTCNIFTKTISSTVSPISFLEKLSPDRKSPLTTTEEIYNEERFKFYKKLSIPYSPAKTVDETNKISSFTPSPQKSRLIRIITSPVTENNQEKPLPGLTKPIKRLCKFKIQDQSALNPHTRHKTINSILKACETTGDKIAFNSKKVKSFIEKERMIARQYTKEMKWTSDKLTELDGFNHQLMKTLYNEYKSFNTLYEKDKLLISKKYNHKSAKDYKAKAKNMKKFLTDFKNKVIP